MLSSMVHREHSCKCLTPADQATTHSSSIYEGKRLTIDLPDSRAFVSDLTSLSLHSSAALNRGLFYNPDKGSRVKLHICLYYSREGRISGTQIMPTVVRLHPSSNFLGVGHVGKEDQI